MSNKSYLIAFLVLVLVTLACSSTANTLEKAAQDSTITSVSSSIGEPVGTKPVNPSEIQLPTNTPEPLPTATIPAEPLQLVDGPVFVQSSIRVDGIFVVQNPNSTQAISSSQYQATIYDESGNILDTDSGYIEIVLPDEKIPVVSNMFVEEGQKAAKIDVQIVSGTAEATELQPPLFTADQITFIADQYFPKVTAILKNNFQRSFSTLRVTAIAYDDQGSIVGGGYTYLDFLPGGGQAGVEVSVNIKGTPAKVDLAATVSSLSILTEDNSQNQSVQLIDSGWSQNRQTVSVGFLVKNNTDQVVDGTQYQATAYDDAGNVLDTQSGYLSYIFPNEQTAGAVSLYLPAGAKSAKVDIQINPGSSSTFALASNPFTTENVNFLAGTYSSKVTGMLKNSYQDKISNVEIVAIGYDKDGNIIVGGFTYVDFVPGNGQAAFEILVDFAQKPEKVDIYPSLGGISSIGD